MLIGALPQITKPPQLPGVAAGEVNTIGEAATSIHADCMRVYLNDAVDLVNKHGKEAINAFADGDEQRMMLLGLKRFTKYGPFNSKDARRRIADKLIADRKYTL